MKFLLSASGIFFLEAAANMLTQHAYSSSSICWPGSVNN